MRKFLQAALTASLLLGCSKGHDNPIAIAGTQDEVYLETVYIDGIPFTDNAGGSWDITTGPDVFVTVVDPLGNLVYDGSGNVREDLIEASLPVGYAIQPPGVFLENWSQSYAIRIYDFDVTGHDLIGSIPFTVNSLISGRGYVPNHRIQNASINLRITVRWE